MNAQGHGKPFDEQGLVDHYACDGAEDKAPDMFFADARFGGGEHPEDPKQQGAYTYTDHIEPEGSDKPFRDILYRAEIDAEEQVGTQYSQM